jgi:polyisoprenoid-binding protein YceI
MILAQPLNLKNPDFSDAKISFEAAIDSIDTKNEQRDGHLKSADFFDAGNYPKLTFVSKSLKKKSDNTFEITGDMTIRGITKEIKIDAVYNGTVKGFGGTDVAGFEITGKLNRFDFGFEWNTRLPKWRNCYTHRQLLLAKKLKLRLLRLR